MSDKISSNPFFTSKPAAPQAAPKGFVRHAVTRQWQTSHSREAVWAWLNAPKTFSKGQLPPWRVEFVSAEPDTPAGFHIGGLNMHHGPLTLFAGTMTDIRENEYRDLQYFYGSHFISVRLVRPTRLQFWLEDADNGGTLVRLQLDSLVHRWFQWQWTLGNTFFWLGFGRMLKRLKRRK